MQRKAKILVSLDFPHDLSFVCFSVERMNKNGALPFYTKAFPAFLRMYLRSFRYDIIMTSRREGKFLGLMYYFFKPARLKHVIYEFIYEQEQSLRGVLSMCIWKAALKRLDRVTVQSTVEIRHYARLFGVNQAKFVYVPIPIEADRLIGPTLNGFIFSAGKTNRDYDLLMEVAAKINHPWVILAGKGDRHIFDRLPPHVSVHFGINKNRYHNFLAQSRLVVIALKNGVSSRGQVTLLEAMALGKPVICTNVPPIRDYAGDDAACVLVPPGNAGALEEKISHLLDNEKDLLRTGRRGYEWVKRAFSRKFFIDVIARVLLNVLQD